jgi:hypothetical protein
MADCSAVWQSMLQVVWKPPLPALERFICKSSPADRILVSIRNGGILGAATGTFAGGAVGGIGAVPGGVLGAMIGEGRGAVSGSVIAGICSAAGMYD